MADDLPTFDEMKQQEQKEKLPSFDEMKAATEKMESSEPSFGTNVLGGATSLPRGAAQLLNEVSGAGKKTKQETSEGTVKTPKVKGAEADPNSGGYLLGQMLAGGFGGAGAAKGIGRAVANAPRLAKLAGPTAVGALTGLTDPVPNVFPDESYWSQKAGQVESGAVLGFGFGMAGKALKPGAAFLANLLFRGDPEALKSRAVNTVLQRIDADHAFGAPSATDMINLLSVAKKPLMLADLGEKHSALKGLTGRIARSQGGKPQAAAALEGRDQLAPERINQDISTHIWAGASKYQLGKDLTAARQAAAAPIYDQLDNIQGIWSPDFQKYFLDEPEIRKALSKGIASERIIANAEKRPFDPTMMGVDLDAEGNIVTLRTPNMRVLDLGKRGLDELIAAQREPITGRLSQRGRDLQILRSAYVKEIDAMDTSGLYKKARETWQGPSRSKDMLAVGNSVFERSDEENADIAAGLDPGDKQFVLAGMADKLREILRKSGFESNEARQLLKNPYAQDQIKPFIKSAKDAQEFIDAVARERQMFGTKTEVLGGSQTAERGVEERSELKPMSFMARTAHHAIRGNVALMAADAFRTLKEMKGKADPELESAVAQILFDPNVWNTDMGKRLAAGVMQRSRKQQQMVDFAQMLKNAPFSPGAAATAGLPSTHPVPGQEQAGEQ